ncbi:MAG: efflux RND transporter permease subunit [Chloroflexi bacterium]|nr:efflux RND transporter permease subunit [Chloroflexota bacterium]
MNIANISIRQPVLITMVMLALVVVGLLGFFRMPINLYPDVSFPYIGVTTVYPGASPAEVQREITKPLEEALGSLNGVKKVKSTSNENFSLVLIEFKMGYSTVRAADDVRTRVATVRGNFPRDVKDPIIQTFDPASAPILSFGIADRSGQMQSDELRRLVVDEIKPRLERIDGVGDISVAGGLIREIQVDLNLDALRARRVTPQQVVAAIQMENMNIPGGRLTDKDQSLLLRTPGDFQKIGELNEIVIPNVQGAPVNLKDIATVRDGFAEAQSYSRLNGEDSIVISIRKRSGTNTVQVAETVKEEMAHIGNEYPNLNLAVGQDDSDFTGKVAEDSIVDLILGGIFASLVVVFFFRDLRNTLVTVVGLPVIMIGSFAVMNALGLSLNMMTLMALALAVGLVIDDAIVVRENIFRHMERGATPKEASSRGTNEVALAVTAMTLTIVAVFLPIAFVTGLIGQFFREFGLAIVIAVVISMFEAFTLAPMLSAYLFKQRASKPGHEHEEGAEARLGWIDRGYRRLLGWTLKHKVVTALGGVATFLLIIGLATTVEMAFLPMLGSHIFAAGLELPPGATLEQTDAQAREIETILKSHPDVKDVFAIVGGEGKLEKASFLIKMRESGLLKRAEPSIRQSLAHIKGLTFTFDMGGGESLETDIAFRDVALNLRTSGSFDDLDRASQDVLAALADVPGLVDLERSYKAGKPEMRIEVDRDRAARMGLSTASVGATVRTLVNGETASRFRESGREADIVVRLRKQDRNRLDEILGLAIPSMTGQLVPLRSVATISTKTGPTAIEREDRQSQIIIGANLLNRTLSTAMEDVQARVARVQLPPGVTLKVGGDAELMEESFGSLAFSLLLSVVFIYMVLASQFRSFTQPLVLMLALPLSILGAFLALLILQLPFDMTAMIGIILLMGLVTKNSILLIDFTNRLREQGMERDQALLVAGPVRLRPILMTTLALILGMLPVALGLGAAGNFRTPMAVAVIGGLITSTLLTLVLVPTAYGLLDSFIAWLKQLRAPAAKPVPIPVTEAEGE